MDISGDTAEKNSSTTEGGGKIIFEKPLTIFGIVIRSSPRWHHCQAEPISSESLKTTVTRPNQAKYLRVRSEVAF